MGTGKTLGSLAGGPIGAVAGTVGDTVGGGIKTGLAALAGSAGDFKKTELEAHIRKRAAELQRKKEMNLLGLTDAERTLLSRDANLAQQAERTKLMNLQDQALANFGGTGSAQSLLAGLQQQEAQARGQQQIAHQIAVKDLEAAAEQEAQLQADLQSIAELEQARAQAKGEAVQAGLLGEAQKEQDRDLITENAASKLTTALPNASEEQIKKWSRMLSDNPQMIDALTSVLK